MAYAAADLHKVGGGVKSIYLYESTDAIGTIVGSGYFNDATNILNQDDVIIAVGATGGTRTVDVCVVTSASRAATVTVTNGT
tara:strand:- start:88 stop:333 length:246 start_codon:yes stop_codon:yes gene_type:complete